MPGKRILIIEDESIVAEDLKKILLNHGYNVSGIVSSGEEAIAKFKELKPDLILMDITVKEDVDDLEAAKHISNFNVPIIFLTNNSSKKLMKQAKAIEPSGYLFKPIKEKELITTIEMTLYKNDMDRTIRESEERYRKLFETSTDALMMLDHSGFFDCNKATLKLFGLSNKEEFLDLHPSEISPRTQPNGESSRLAADRHINHAFRKGLNKFNWVHKRKNGEDFPAEVWLTAFRLNGKDVLQATVRDLTESRKAKEELQKAHDELENRIKERTAELTKSNEQLQKEINDRIKVETALQRKTHQQALLLKTARYINSSLDVNEVLKRIASEVMELLSSYGCTIYLLAEDGKTLFPQVVTDPVYEKEIMSTPLDIDSSFTGKAVKAKQSLMFNNAVANENGYQIPGTSEEEEERIIVAPFVSDGKVLGAMCLNRIGPYYTEEDLALAETFAHYATTALKNAQTFQELQHEIDERIQAEKAQMESEKRYEDLQSNIPVCIFRSTPQGKLISVNPAMIKMFGFNSEKDIKAVSTKDFYPNSDDREKLMKILLTEGLVSDFEVELYRKDKSILWCSLNIKTIHDEDGKWIYQDGIITDISERKQAEKTQSVLYNIANAVNSTKNLNDLFKRIHQELGRIIDTTNYYIALYEEKTNMISAAYYVDELTKETPPPQPLKKGLTAYVIKTGKSIFLTPEKRAKLMKEGKIAQAEWKSKLWLGVPLKIENKVIGAMAVQSYQDQKAFEKKDLKILEFVSDQIAIAVNRKRAEEALRTSEQLNRAVIDNSPLGITARDKNGTLLIANEAWCKIWEKTKDQMTLIFKQRTKLSFDEHDLYLGDHISKVKEIYEKGGKYYIPEIRIERKGKTKWISHYFYAIQDDKKNVDKVVILTEDITKRQQAEEKFLRTQSRLTTLFKNVPNIILYETGGEEDFISENIYDLLGYPAEDFIKEKTKFSSLIHPEDKEYINQKYAEWEKAGKKDLLTLWFRVKKADGSYMWIEDRMVEITSEKEKTYRAGVKIDITNLKLAEEEIKESYKKLKRLLEETVNGLVSAVEMRDPYTAGHQRRVAILATALAKEMGLTEKQIEGLNLAALVHDIGKINVPAEILSKPGKLTPTEFNLIKMHPQTGYDILKSIEFPWPVAEMVLQHQERYDGSSYPQGLKGEDIDLKARILSVADVIEAMSSHRPYRPSLGIDAALEEIEKNRGILYDPDVVDACLILFHEKGFAFSKHNKKSEEKQAN